MVDVVLLLKPVIFSQHKTVSKPASPLLMKTPRVRVVSGLPRVHC